MASSKSSKPIFADDTNVLYLNNGKGNFDDVTMPAGLGVETQFVSWGAGIVDLDNDRPPDLFVVTGSVYPEVERRLHAYLFKTPRLMFRNLGEPNFSIDQTPHSLPEYSTHQFQPLASLPLSSTMAYSRIARFCIAKVCWSLVDTRGIQADP